MEVPGTLQLVGSRNKRWDHIDPNLDPDLIVEDDSEWHTYVAQAVAFATGAFAVPRAKGDIKRIVATAYLANNRFVVYVEAPTSVVCSVKLEAAWQWMFIDDRKVEPVEEVHHRNCLRKPIPFRGLRGSRHVYYLQIQ